MRRHILQLLNEDFDDSIKNYFTTLHNEVNKSFRNVEDNELLVQATLSDPRIKNFASPIHINMT